MKKKNAKKLELPKETLRTLDLKEAPVAGQQYFDPDRSMNRACTFSTIA